MTRFYTNHWCENRGFSASQTIFEVFGVTIKFWQQKNRSWLAAHIPVFYTLIIFLRLPTRQVSGNTKAFLLETCCEDAMVSERGAFVLPDCLLVLPIDKKDTAIAG
jgi:hypothetical protein